MERKAVVSPDSALGADIFDKFCSAQTLKSILGHFRHLCQVLHVQPTNFHQFYPKLKAKLRSWKAQALWNKFDKRASHKCYNRGKTCHNTRVLVIGAGPCGLRAAIEAQLLGCKVVVVEKRDRMSRNNVLHLWPFVIHDLRGLGAKKFFGKFCAGAIDHISIRQLQCILLKVALIFGVEIHEGVGFESLSQPREDENERVGWRAVVDPPDHPVRQYEFDVLIGADGKRNTLDGFKRKEFRGKLAIAITANFINRKTEAEARVEEISGVAFIFNQSFFRELYERTGIDLENIVYYKDDTHYFVMTAKKHSLIDKGVILNDYSDTYKLLAAENVDRTALMEYAREAADFSSRYRLPQLDFAVNHYGQPDIAMFDFTSMYAAENASRVLEVNGHRLLIQLVGDSLLEPFWPTGSGCARGFLSSMDACWALRSWALGAHPLQVVAERESIYRLLAQTTPENLNRDHQGYTLDPHTRYPNLNINAVLPVQVKGLYTTDDLPSLENFLKAPSTLTELPKKRRRRDSQVAPETLLHWLQRQVAPYENVKIQDMTLSFKDGIALCAIIYRYRPHLIPDFHSLNREDVAKNNQLAFDILEKEFAIPPMMRGEDMASNEEPDQIALMTYLSQVYDAFRGEIPHIKHPKLEEVDEEEAQKDAASAQSHAVRLKAMKEMTPSQKATLLSRITSSRALNSSKHHHATPRKRRSTNISDRENRSLEGVKRGGKDQDFSVRVKDLEAKLRGALQGKKPKDLLRAIGKIEKTDWNVKEIEKKMQENRMGRGLSGRTEKVPKWSKQQFNDKFTVMEKKLQGQNEDNRYQEIDNKLIALDKKVREGSTLEVGQRGSNKVSAMAAHLTASIYQDPPKPQQPVESSVKKEVMLATNGGSELCHFCNKRVYLMERQTAEGRFFHRGCFRCQYCYTALRLGNYAFDRDGRYGRRFFCMQHFGMEGNIKDRRRGDVKGPPTPLPAIPPSTEQVDQLASHTPERIEFENLSECVEVEEDEWTDRNFGATSTDSSDISESSSESGDEEALAEALEAGLDPEETLRLAEDWTKRYASCTDTSYHHSPDEDSDSKESEAEEMKKARELRKQEVPAEPIRPSNTDTGSDTEVGSDDYSESSSEESDQEDNSATEISTDSEFEHDGTIHTIPDIVISDAVQVKKGELDQPKQVQLINRPLNGKIEPLTKEKDIRLELRKIEDWKPSPFKPIVNNDKPTVNNNILHNTNDKAVLNNRPKPFINPNKGDYLINRTQSTEGIASKISLELKKKYLFGPTGPTGNVRKSGSTSTLDTKFKNLIDQISENQKMLHPAPEPSPTMQAILQGADKIKTSPVVSPLPNLLIRKQLPAYHDFKHVCGLKEEKENKENEEKNKIRDEIESVVPKESEDKKSDEEEVRPRSPVHETSIVVPNFPRADINEDDMESDSLSSSSEESTDDDDSLEEGSNEALIHSPPKLEIHNSRGELMDEDGQQVENNLPDVCQQNEPIRDKLDLVPSCSESRDTSLGRVITVPSPDKSDGELLKKVTTPRELYVTPEPPATPDSREDSDSFKNESMAAALTETELSDWARDEEPMASETLDDLELNSDNQLINFRKHQGPKNRRNVRGVAAKIAKAENFDDEFTHVCGKAEKPDSLPISSVLNDTDNIRFMDTGEEDEISTDEDGGVKNKALMNNGYIPLVSPSDEDELPTPLVEAQNFDYLAPNKEDEDSKHTEFTDTTTTSDATTVKNHVQEKSSSSSASELRDKPGPLETCERDYETYVQRLQGRISPFRNVRDSIGIIKDKKKYKLPHSKSSDDTTQDDSVAKATIETYANEQYKTTTDGRTPTSPTTSRKLEQISKERSFQKDLVHEMVMNKLISQGKSPVERNKKRSSRGSCSPLGGILTSSSVSSIASSAPKQDSIKSSQQLSKSSMNSVVSERAKHEEWLTPVSRRVGSTSERSSMRPRSIAVTSTPHGKLPSSAEAFSLPDIHKAVESEFKTPLGPPPTLRSDLRESAKAKYKMMSDEELGLSPEEKLKRLRERFNKYLSSSFEKLSTPSASTSKVTEESDKSKKVAGTPDRKRSIIQAVSDFFHKKTPSPPKTPSSHSPTKLLKFKSSKSKESISEEPPPIPPLPQSYTPSHDDSWSEDDSKLALDEVISSLPKKHKLSQRLLRQAQNKRLRMAQEMQRELEEVEVKQRELEARGVAVEKALRGEQTPGINRDNEVLMSELFALMRESSRLRAREKELSISAQQLELDDRHARLQLQFKLLINSQDKSADDVALEGELLREMLEIVEKKEYLVKQLDQERLRGEDEYKNLEAQMLAKGLRTPASTSQGNSFGGPGHTPGPTRPPLVLRKNSY